MSAASEGARLLSKWVDEAPKNAGRNREALMWHRVMKVAEESGEVMEAMIRFVDGNPRKAGDTRDAGPVIKELLDVALAALGGVEHLTGNAGLSGAMLDRHAEITCERAGLGRP